MRKDLKRMSSDDHKKILNDNRDFYEKITSEYFVEQKKEHTQAPAFSWKKFSFAMASVLVVVIVCCTLLFTLLPSQTTESPSGQSPDDGELGPGGIVPGPDAGPDEPSPPPDDEASVASDYLTLSAYFVDIEIPEDICQTITLYYAPSTKRSIYFRIENKKEETRYFDMDLTCAGETLPDCDESQFTQSKIFKGYEVKYEITRNEHNPQAFVYSVNALIKLPSQTVRFNFRDIAQEHQPDDFFFDWLEDNIAFK